MVFLFNANDIKYSDYYGYDIEQKIWECNILQSVENEMTIYQGDIITTPYIKTIEQSRELLNRILINAEPAYLKKNILEYVFTFGCVYVWWLKGISNDLSQKLHSMLWQDTGYLGMFRMENDNIIHRILFDDFLVKKYIISGYQVKIIADTLNEDDYRGKIDFLKEMGFQKVTLMEDTNELY